MAHLVQYPAADGEPVTREVADLAAAVALVEQLRNADRVEDVRVFAEVPLRFETYVRVSVASGDAAAAPEPVVAELAPVPAGSADDEPAPVTPPAGVLAPVRVEAPTAEAPADEVEQVGAEGRRSLFGRG